MIFDSEIISKYSFKEILNAQDAEYKSLIANKKHLVTKETREHEEKLKNFKETNYFLYKEPEMLTLQEKEALCANMQRYIKQQQLLTAFLGNSDAKAFSDLIKNYSNPNKVNNVLLEEAQSLLIDMCEPKEYNVDIVESLEKERHVFHFKLSKNDLSNDKFIKKTEALASELLSIGKQVRIVINDPMISQSNKSSANYVYTKEEMQKLIDLNNRLIDKGMKKGIVFNEYSQNLSEESYDKSWDINEVIKANESLDKVVDSIKNKNLSPFEAMTYVHYYITKTFAYSEGKVEECRVIPGIFKENKIVCSGYASLVKAIIDKLDMPELKCDILSCDLYQKKPPYKHEGGHCHNLIKISDKKYGIDGYYIEDACWDAKTEEFKKGRGFAHCLYPVGDLEHIKDMYYVQETSDNRLASLIFDPKDLIEMNETRYERKRISAFAQYMERRKEIKTGAEVVKKYAHLSPPIAKEKYMQSLTCLYEKAHGQVTLKDTNTIKNDMLNSDLFGSLGFDQDASSEFASNRNIKQIKKQIHKRNSLATNDGRQE